MVKDEIVDRESTVKKRRKVLSIFEQTNQEEDVYKRVVDFEELEAKSRSADKDAALYCKTCQNIRDMLSEISELKKLNTDEARAEISEKRIQVSLQFVLLKKLNRLDKIRMKSSRDVLHKEKQRVDSTQLQLHNLLYELEHLKKEITKCLQFKSKDEEIDLVPVEEFYSEAPETISKPDITKTDEHRLRLARLEWELHQRKLLSELCQKLQAGKSKAASDIVSKQERLDGLAPRLNHVLEVTKPLQEYLGLPMEKIRQQHELASLLPDPLFLLFYQADAYRQVYDKNASVAIIGDEEEARQLKEAPIEEATDSDTDCEAEDNGELDTNDKHHRKSHRPDKQEEKRTKLLAKHPLSVRLSIKASNKTTSEGPELHVNLYYLLQLRVVTVKSEVIMNQPLTGVSAGDVITSENLMTELFPMDTGDNSPNISNHYQLHRAGLGAFSTLLDQLGRPYMWAQLICGLTLMSPISESTGTAVPSKSLCQANIETIMKAIKNRFSSRIALCAQMQALENCKISSDHENDAKFGVPEKLRGSLEQWLSVSWSEFIHNGFSKNLVEEQHISEKDMLYKAVISRGAATLISFVAIKNDFPSQPPVFSIAVHYNGEFHAGNSDAIRDMERTMNVAPKQVKPNYTTLILPSLLKRLIACFDIYLETTAPSDFPQEKIFFSPVRGRNRSRPYRYLSIGGGIFTQY